MCGAIFFSLIYCHYCHSEYNCLIVIDLSVAIRAFLIATYCHFRAKNGEFSAKNTEFSKKNTRLLEKKYEIIGGKI